VLDRANAVTNAIILIFIFASLDSSVVASRTTSANESLLFLHSVRNTREGYKVNTSGRTGIRASRSCLPQNAHAPKPAAKLKAG